MNYNKIRRTRNYELLNNNSNSYESYELCSMNVISTAMIFSHILDPTTKALHSSLAHPVQHCCLQ